MTPIPVTNEVPIPYKRPDLPRYSCPLPSAEGCGGCACRDHCDLGCLGNGLRRRVIDEKIARLYRAGQDILCEGDRPQGLMILCGGAVRLSLSTTQGRKLTLKYCSCGEIFGEAAYMAGEPHFFSAEAARDSYVCLVPRALADELLKASPEFLMRMAVKSSSQLGATMRLASDWVFKSADARLADFLLSAGGPAAGTPSCGSDRGMTRREVAERVGLAPETVIRRLSAFKRRGMVRLSGRSIDILDKGALQIVAADAR